MEVYVTGWGWLAPNSDFTRQSDKCIKMTISHSMPRYRQTAPFLEFAFPVSFSRRVKLTECAFLVWLLGGRRVVNCFKSLPAWHPPSSPPSPSVKDSSVGFPMAGRDLVSSKCGSGSGGRPAEEGWCGEKKIQLRNGYQINVLLAQTADNELGQLRDTERESKAMDCDVWGKGENTMRI